MAVVELRGVGKVYPNGVEAVSGVDLTLGAGEYVALVGPSGSGKSTLLRIIAGLEASTSGSVHVGGREVTASRPRDRDVAMVFQEPALFPYLSVFDNLAFGLRARKVDGAEVRSRVESVAASLGLGGMLGRRPETLSGGQRQRVALGRAVVRRAAVCLLDEPLSGLDAPLRAGLRGDLFDLQRRHSLTTLHVTHDQAEALAVGDRVGVMERGRLVQVGRPEDVYRDPATRFVAGFVGNPPMSLIPCAVGDGDGSGDFSVAVEGAGMALRVAGSRYADALRSRAGGRVELGLRPEHVRLAPAGEGPGLDPRLVWSAEPEPVRRVEFLGHESVVTVGLGPHAVRSRRAGPAGLRAGDRCVVGFDPAGARWFDAETGAALAPGRPDRDARRTQA